MFTVKQYLDKHFKLNGLGKAQHTIWTETIVGVFGGFFGGWGGLIRCFGVSHSTLGPLVPFPSPQGITAASDISLAEAC